MTKLFQINITANCGSHGKIAEGIGQLAIKKGWESYIAYGREARQSHSHLYHIGTMWDERWHGVQTRLLDKHGLGSKQATKKLLEKMDEVKPDIVHLHNIHGYYLNYPLLFQYLASHNLPTVWTLHDCWPFTGHCVHFELVSCQLWKTQCHDCPLLRSYPASLWKDNSENNFQLKKYYFNLPKDLVIVPVSDWLANLVNASFLSHHRIVTIHNGINLDLFKPIPSDIIRRNRPIVLAVASVWNKEKGLQDLIQLAQHRDIQLVIIGVTEKQKHSLPSHIIAIARTANQTELAKYYTAADVLVNPTYADNFPTVNLEALACGTPVVTYNVGGSPESLTADTGIVVPTGDVEALYQSVKKMVSPDATHRLLLRQRCVTRAQCFDFKNRFQDYIDLYEDLLSHKDDYSLNSSSL
jgi:putative colanic acid biosynthesis glycosyltransferase